MTKPRRRKNPPNATPQLASFTPLEKLFRWISDQRWGIVGAIIVGAIFALFTFVRLEAFNSFVARVIAAVFLFGVYFAIVAFGTAGRRRTLSLAMQTGLGVLVACVIALLFHAPPAGLLLAAIIGVILGYTADKWMDYIQLP